MTYKILNGQVDIEGSAFFSIHVIVILLWCSTV